MLQSASNKKPAGQSDKWIRIGTFAIMFCIIAALAMVHENAILGFVPGKDTKNDSPSAVRKTESGEIVNTSSIGKDIIGYGGTVPLEIYITANRIDSVRALPNNETGEIFQRLYDKGLMSAWNGKTLQEAARFQVDGITGATYSSNAVKGNVRAGVDYLLGTKEQGASKSWGNISLIAALLVILSAAIVPLATHPGQRFRLIQQILNVVILGFWAGVFIDYSMMLNFFAHGFTFSLAGIVTLVLLVVGWIYPVFKKPGYYCAWICPFGSLQELAGKIRKNKIKISPRVLKALDLFRNALWVGLLSLLFIGWAYQWIDYEIFTAFIVRSASWAVICVGALFVMLSVFINRPFCRFVCPTGTLLKNI